MDSMPGCMYFIVWTVTLMIQSTQGENRNFCDMDSQNPNYTFTETFEKSTDDLHCRARNENSVITKLYHCVNDTGILLNNCSNGQNSITRSVSTNCTVTVHAENVSQTFYCLERGLFDQMDQLSAHYSVIVVSDGSVDVPVTVQASSPIATSDQPSMEQTTDTHLFPHKNGGKSENIPAGMLVAMVLISILSTSLVTSKEHYHSVMENNNCYILKNSRQTGGNVINDSKLSMHNAELIHAVAIVN